MSLRSRSRNVIVVAATLLILAILVTQVGGGPQNIHAAGRDIRWPLLPLPLGLLVLAFLVAVAKWRLVLNTMGFALPFRMCIDAVLATWPVSAATPSRAGDFLRAWHIKAHVPLASGIGSTLAERLIDIHGLTLIAAAGSAAAGLWHWFIIAAGMLVIEILSVALALRHQRALLRLPVLRRMDDKLAQLFSALDSVWAHPRRLLAISALSLLSWSLSLGIIYSLLLLANAALGIGAVASLWPLAVLVGLLPVTLAGMGTRDAAFVYLVGSTGSTAAEPSRILLATFGYSLLATWLLALIGLPFMLRAGLRREDAQTPSRKSTPDPS
jgi:glycosyltransferase 2 family protein